MSNICRLCDKESSLRQSHAIPDSIFRRLFKANSGKAILLSSGLEDIEYTSDSLDTPQLCGSCEALINTTYERYSIDALRDRWGTVKRNAHGITFKKIDANKLCMFFVAIFWRAANSSHSSYSGAVMPIEFFRNDTNNFLKQALLNNTPVPTKTISIKLQRLIDPSEGFDLNTLKDFIVVPFHRPYGPKRKVSVCFVIEGFLITLVMPGLSIKERKSDLVINRKRDIVTAKFIDIFSDETLKNFLLENYHKVKTGQSRIGSS